MRIGLEQKTLDMQLFKISQLQTRSGSSAPNNAEMESSSVNKQPVNNSPFKMFYILGNTSKHLSWRIEMKA